MQKFINKEQFLEEHNRLSPSNLKATLALLNRFREEKKPLLKDTEWCLDKHRIPFIVWLTSLPKDERAAIEQTKTKIKATTKKQIIFKNYPETHYEN